MRIGPSGSGFNELPLLPERATERPRTPEPALPAPTDSSTAPERRERFPKVLPNVEVERLRERVRGTSSPAIPEGLPTSTRKALAAYREAAGDPARDELNELLGLDLHA
ncbi:MAG: hypothetical protein HYV16_09805 [Gammaproteobacteria bacterium]|nr:hypothetical protein [Gammaproteobacteria bacterium]